MYEKVADGGTSFFTKYFLSGLFARWLRPNTRGVYWWDDVPSDTSSQVSLTLGQSVTSQAESSGDRDWYRISLEAGQTYNIDAGSMERSLLWLPAAGAAASLSRPANQAADLLLEVRDSQGQLIISEDDTASLLAPHIQFQPTVSGDYFISVGGFAPHTGSYSIGVNLPGIDPATSFDDQSGLASASAASFRLGQRLTGAVDYSGDVDWFKVSLAQWETYSFQLKDLAPWHPASSFDPMLNLHSSAGDLLASDDDGGGWLDAEITYQATASGWYYLGLAGQGASKGAWAFTSSQPDDYSADVNTTGTVAVGGQARGSIGRVGDQDWFKVSLAAGTPYQIDLEGAANGQGTLANPYLYVYDNSGALVTQIDDGGAGYDSRLSYVPTAGGWYYLGAAGSGTGTYRLRLAASADDHGGDTSTQSSLAVGGWAGGAIGTGSDQDWFKVTLTAGHLYLFDLEGADTGQGTLAKPSLYLYSFFSTFYSLAASDARGGGAGYNARLFYQPSVTGVCYLAARGASGTTGTYRLSGTELSDDCAGDTSTTATLSTNNVAVTGVLVGSGDKDWFAITLNADTPYVFTLQGISGPDGPGVNQCRLSLYDSSGRGNGGDGANGPGTSASVIWSSGYTGVWYVEVSDGFYGNSNLADHEYYSLTATPFVDAAAGDASTTATLAVGGSATGTAHGWPDHDYFKVNLAKGQHYAFDMEGAATGRGTANNAELKLFDDSGNQVSYDNNGGAGANSRITYTAPYTGLYYLDAQNNNGGVAYTYRVSANLLADDQPDPDPAGVATLGSRATTTLATPTTPGGISGTGRLESSGDQDLFKISLVAGQSYSFHLGGLVTGTDSSWNDFEFLLYNGGSTGGSSYLVYDSYMQPCRQKMDYNFTYKPTASGYYVMDVKSGDTQSYIAYNDTGTALYGYTVGALIDDYSDSSTGAYTLTLSGSTATVAGSIEASGDIDWFKVSLAPHQLFQFDLMGMDSGKGVLRNLIMPLSNGNGDLNTFGSGGMGYDARAVEDSGNGGWFYVAAQTNPGVTTGTYTLNIAQKDDDYLADTGTTGAIAIPNASDGFSITDGGAWGWISSNGLTATDHDWFRVYLEADREYEFSFGGYNLSTGSLNLYDSSGTTNLTNNGLGSPGNAGFTTATNGSYLNSYTGFYYLDVSGVGPFSGQASYGLQVSAVGQSLADHAPDSVTSAAPLFSVGDNLTGVLETANDQDWYQVNLTQGHQYKFVLGGADAGQGTVAQPVLGLFKTWNTGSPWIWYAGGNDDGYTSVVEFQAQTSGVYYLGAMSRNAAGTYQLSSWDVTGTDDYAGDLTTTGSLNAGSSLTGIINVGEDHDWFAVSLDLGKEYKFTLIGQNTSTGSIWAPTLALRSSTGEIYEDSGESFNGNLSSTLTLAPQSYSGVYWIDVRENDDLDWGRGYAISMDDISDNNNVTTPANLSMGSANRLTSAIEAQYDKDYYRVSLTAGQCYQFDLYGSSTYGTANNDYVTKVKLFLASTSGSTSFMPSGTYNADGANARVTYSPTVAGVYLVGVEGFDQTGSYAIEGKVIGDDFTTGNPIYGTDTNGVLGVGGSITGAINATGDKDWFKISLAANTPYQFDLYGATNQTNTLSRPQLDICGSSSGVSIRSDSGAGDGFDGRVIYRPTVAGYYYLKVQATINNAEGGNNQDGFTGTYRLSSIQLADDYAGDTSTAGLLSLGSSASPTASITGALDDVTDQDWFRVSLRAGTRYVFDEEGAATGKGSLIDPKLYLYGSTGVQLSVDSNGGISTNAVITFTPTSSGYYYLRASGESDSYQPQVNGTYTISAVTDDYAGDLSTAGAITLPSSGGFTSVTGSIERNSDRDWFKVTLNGGTSYALSLEGMDAGQGTLADPVLYLQDASGVMAASADGGRPGHDAGLRFTPVASGVFYLSAGAAGDSGIGTYRLGAIVDDYAGDAFTTATLAVDGSITGSLETLGDHDWFKVSLTAGQAYQVNVDHFGSTPLAYTGVTMYNASGYLIWSGGGSGGGNDTQRVFEVAEGYSGTYYLSVHADAVSESTAQTAGRTGGYSLSLQGIGASDQNGDISDSSSTAYTLTSSPTSGSPVSFAGALENAWDYDWFSVSLTGGTAYNFQVLGGDFGQNALQGMRLSFISPDGQLFEDIKASGDGHGSSLNLQVCSDQSGYYKFRVGSLGMLQTLSDISQNPSQLGAYEDAFSLMGKTLGPYQVTISQGADDDVPGDWTTNTVVTLAAGAPVSGTLGAVGDEDWYKVNLTAGTAYAFNLIGSWDSSGNLSDDYTLRNTRLLIYTSSGSLVWGNQGGGNGLNSLAMYAPTASGYYYVVAKGDISGYNLATLPPSTGTYSIGYDVVADDVAGYKTTTASVTTTNVAVSGVLQGKGDKDWFAVSLAQYTPYVITLRGLAGANGPGLVAGNLSIMDSSGMSFGSDTKNWDGTSARLVFTSAAYSGTWYVQVSDGSGSSVIADREYYSLTVSPLDSTPGLADIPGTTATTATLAVGGFATSTALGWADYDWFKVNLVVGQHYAFDLEGVATGKGQAGDLQLELWSDDGGSIEGDNSGGSGGNARLTYTACYSGTYFLKASNRNTGLPLTYRVSASLLADDQPDPDPAGIATLGSRATTTLATPTDSTGISGAGTLETEGDQDLFKISLVAGQGYYFHLGGLVTDTWNQFQFLLYNSTTDSTSSPLGRDYNSSYAIGNANSLNLNFTYKPSVSGVYVMDVKSGDQQSNIAWGNTGTALYGYTVGTVTDDNYTPLSDVTSGTESGGTSATAIAWVGGSATVGGTIEAYGDIDWFKVSLAPNKLYDFELTGLDSGAGTLKYPQMYVSQSGDPGSSLNYYGGGGSGRDIQTYIASGNGGWFNVGAFVGSWYTGTGTYQLNVQEATDDYSAGDTTNGAIALFNGDSSNSAQGYLSTNGTDESDHDWFRVYLQGGKAYSFGFGDNSLAWGSMVVRDSAGSSQGGIIQVDDPQANQSGSYFSFTPTDSGFYFLDVSGVGDFEGQACYQVLASVTGQDLADQAPDDMNVSPVSFNVGDSFTGMLETASDQDWYQVDLEAGHQYKFVMGGSTAGGLGTVLLSNLGVYKTWNTSNPYTFYFHHGGEGLNSEFLFTAQNSGTYYLVATSTPVGGTSAQIGAYTLASSDISGEDDYAAASTTSGSLSVDETKTGFINAGEDHDWFAVSLQLGKEYQFTLTSQNTDTGSITMPRLSLHSSTGATFNDYAGSVVENVTSLATLTFAPKLYSGVYWIDAREYSDLEWGRGYAISMADISDGNYSNSAGSLTIGAASITSAIEALYDKDFYRVSLTAGQNYQFDLFGAKTFGAPDSNFISGAKLFLSSTSGATSSMPYGLFNGDGTDSRLTFSPSASGVYLVGVEGSSQTGSYALSGTVITDDYTTGTPLYGSDTNGGLSVGGSLTGTINAIGDRDWFKISLSAGTAYRFDAYGAADPTLTLTRPQLNLYSSSSASSLFGDGGSGDGTNTVLVYRPTVAGVYYLCLQGGSQPDSSSYNYPAPTGTYRLSATLISDDYAGDTSTTGQIALGANPGASASISGRLEAYTDSDWFRVSLVAGNAYRFKLQGQETNPYTLPYGGLSLYDSAGYNIAYDYGSGVGGQPLIDFMPSLSGVYYLKSGFNGGGGWSYSLPNTGNFTYNVAASNLGTFSGDETNKSLATAQTLSRGVAHGSGIEGIGDQDWYKVSLAAGQAYRFDLKGSSSGLGTLGSATIMLYDSAGNLLPGALDSGGGSGTDSRLNYMVQTSGNYYLEVAGSIGYGNNRPTGTYDVSYGLFNPGDNSIGGTLELSSLDGSKGFALNGAYQDGMAGFSVSNIGDLNQDGYDDIFVGEPGASPGGRTGVGCSYVVFGKNTDWSGSIDLTALNGSNGFVLNGIATGQTLVNCSGDQSGNSVASAGDINGDGYVDLVIGAGAADRPGGGGIDAGAAYVVFGHSGGWSASVELASLNGANGFAFIGDTAGEHVGGSVNSAGDINGDGYDDFLIGSSDYGRIGLVGTSYVVFGKSDGWSATLHASSLNGSNGFVMNGTHAYDYFGQDGSSVGDINGDGLDDMIIGASNYDINSGHSAGQAYVVFGHSGSWSASLDMDSLDGSDGFLIQGGAVGDLCGFSVAGAGDINGDGLDDFIVGAYGASPGGDASAGSAYVVFGHSGGWAGSLNVTSLDGSNGFVINGAVANDILGESVNSAGDVNNDGYDDIVLGDEYASPGGVGGQTGVTYVIFGKSGGWSSSLDVSALTSSAGWVINGINQYDRAGMAASAAGDVNDDGYDDVIVGAWTANTHGLADTGQAYVVFGGPTTWSAPATDDTMTYDLYRSDSHSIGALTVGGAAASGALQVLGDTDWFAVSLAANHLYSFAMQVNNGSDTPLATVTSLSLLTASGSSLASAHANGAGYDTVLTFAPSSSGTYYLAAGGTGCGVGGYVVTGSDISASDDWAGGTETAGAMSLPTDSTRVTCTGVVNANADRDWFQVDMTTGNGYHFDLFGADSALGTLVDPCLYLYDSAGALILTADGGGQGNQAHLDYDPSATGTYFVGVGASGDIGTGTYQLVGWDPPLNGLADDSGLSFAMAATLSQTQGTGTQLGESLLAAANSVCTGSLPAVPLPDANGAGTVSSHGGGSDAPASSPSSSAAAPSAASAAPGTTAASSTASASASTTVSTLIAAANTQVAAPTLTAPTSVDSATVLVAPH